MERSQVKLKMFDDVVCIFDKIKGTKKGQVMNLHGDHAVIIFPNCRYGYGVAHNGLPYEDSDIATTVIILNGEFIEEPT